MRRVTKENIALWEEVELLLEDKGYTEDDILEVYAKELDECGDDFIDCFRYSEYRYIDVCETPPYSIERRMYDIEFDDDQITLIIPEDAWLIIYIKDAPTIIGRCDLYRGNKITYQENLSELD